MRETQQLDVEARSGTGKGAAFRARQKGMIPGVVYGGGGDPESIAVPRRELERHVGTGTFLTTPFKLAVDGKATRVIPRDVQLDPVTDRPVHVDFMRLQEGTKIVLAIPVRFRGQEASPGIKRGGVVNIVRHEIEVLCPVENIPEFIEVDLSGLEIHGTVHISAIKLPEGVVPMVKERDFTIASIVAPTSVIEEARAAAAAAAAAAAGGAPAEGAAAAPAEGGAAAAPAAGAAPAKAAEKK
ncbi:MAG: 50S ribosomal protein L25/general stress protein Ctc [Alphaproteobacteria bacterium]|nr:50S ribosomal protein L25/general stress protein Ctc [Alphaproteobacteria bacterium]